MSESHAGTSPDTMIWVAGVKPACEVLSVEKCGSVSLNDLLMLTDSDRTWV